MLHIAEQIEINRTVRRLRQGANSAAQLTKIRVAVAWLDALESSAQLRIIGDRLREQFHFSAQCHNLCLLAARPYCERSQRLLFRVVEPRCGRHAARTGPHAKRSIENYQ